MLKNISMKRSITYTISTKYENHTIDYFIRSQGFSVAVRTALKHTHEGILLNGIWSYTNSILHSGDTLVLTIDEKDSSEKIVPTNLLLSIIYEDEDIMVINKPANMPIHPSINHYENTLANALAYYFNEQNKEFVFRCVNRLDRDTTGLTLIAKNLFSASVLYPATARHEIIRKYIAIIDGNLEGSGTVEAPIARMHESTVLRTVDWTNGAKAVTHYSVIAHDKANEHTLVSLQLETGRTHQIRVHMKYLGYPLAGDYLYNPESTIISRTALHSASIEFKHPITGEPMHFEAPLPADMSEIIY